MLACCLLMLTRKRTLRAIIQQTLTHYGSNTARKQQAKHRRVACVRWRANVVSASTQTTP